MWQSTQAAPVDASGCRWCGVVVGAGEMALGTHAVAFHNQLVAVRVMAVGTGHTGLMHLALNEGAVHVHFVADLPVRPVERFFDDSQTVGIEQRLAGVVLAQRAAPGVTARAAVNLVVSGQRFTALCDIGAFSPLPGTSRLEAHRKAGLGGRQASRIGERDVLTARPMTGLTAHIDLLVVGIEPVVHRVVAFLDVGAVTFRAAGIPVKETARPMQRVAGRNMLVGVEVVPPLSALAFGPGVPGHRERLQPAIAEGQQILLQGLNPKHILDRISLQLTRSVIGLDEKGVPFLAEGGGDAKIIECCVVEVAQDRLGRGLLHRQIVVGVSPVGSGLLVAAGAGGIAEIRRAVSPYATGCGQQQGKRDEPPAEPFAAEKRHDNEVSPLGQV